MLYAEKAVVLPGMKCYNRWEVQVVGHRTSIECRCTYVIVKKGSVYARTSGS
jgi:hypothetical protein